MPLLKVLDVEDWLLLELWGAEDWDASIWRLVWSCMKRA